MAYTRPSKEAPYEQSRSTLREIYGSRKIGGRAGGGAPQSPLDYTPSGRMANALKETKDKTAAADKVVDQFYSPFQPRPLGFFAQPAQPTGRPTGWDSAYKQPTGNQVSPEQIAQYQAGGIKPSFWDTPYGRIRIDTANPMANQAATADTSTPTPLAFNLSTPSPLNASALAPYAPKPITSYTPPWKRNQQVPSFMDTVLNGASKWLT